jgi:hypothetical protein
MLGTLKYTLKPDESIINAFIELIDHKQTRDIYSDELMYYHQVVKSILEEQGITITDFKPSLLDSDYKIKFDKYFEVSSEGNRVKISLKIKNTKSKTLKQEFYDLFPDEIKQAYKNPEALKELGIE